MPVPTHVAEEIARLMRDPDALRHERERMPSSGRRGHYDPNQPRRPAGDSDGGQWTDDNGDTAASELTDRERPQLAQFSPDRPPVRPPVAPPVRPPAAPGPLGALLTLFAIWSARNTAERRAIFEFNAKQYLVDPSGELIEADVETLNRREVQNACPGLEKVQEKTDKAVGDVLANGGWSLSPQQFGTAVHKRLEHLIKNDPLTNLQAEVSRVKSERANQDYGIKDSVRIDVLECAEARTTCAYDIKTGESRNSGLSPRRMREIALHAIKACPDTRRVVVTEVRPSQ
jgi:hypothetical protein